MPYGPSFPFSRNFGGRKRGRGVVAQWVPPKGVLSSPKIPFLGILKESINGRGFAQVGPTQGAMSSGSKKLGKWGQFYRPQSLQKKKNLSWHMQSRRIFCRAKGGQARHYFRRNISNCWSFQAGKQIIGGVQRSCSWQVCGHLITHERHSTSWSLWFRRPFHAEGKY